MAPSQPTPAPPVGEQLRLADWANIQLHLIWIYEGQVSHFGRKGHIQSDEMSAWLLQEGSVRIEGSKGSLAAEKGEWVIRQPGLCYQEFSTDARILSLHFQACWPGGQNLFDEGLPLSFPSHQFPHLEGRARRISRVVRAEFQDAEVYLPLNRLDLETYLRFENLFNSWFTAFASVMRKLGILHSRLGSVDERVRRAMLQMDRLPISETIDETVLANEVGLSRSQLDRLFVNQFGFTPYQYFEKRRLDFARRSLAVPSAMVKMIAFELGFRSASHFSTWFRRRTDVSPSEFSKRAKTSATIFR